MIFIRVTLMSGLLLLSGGCFLGKKPVVQVPVAVPAPPVAATPPPAVASEQPAPVQAAPAIPAPGTTTPPPSSPPTESGKPSPFPPITRPAPRPTATVPPVTPPAASPPTLTPAPALGAMLSADQRKQLNSEYLANLNQANQVLRQLTGRKLTTEQLESVSRAKTWIQQAGQFHSRDLATAAELARRARILTEDLASALK